MKLTTARPESAVLSYISDFQTLQVPTELTEPPHPRVGPLRAKTAAHTYMQSEQPTYELGAASPR